MPARCPTAILDALEHAVIGETRPDLTLVIDMDVGEGLARAHARRVAKTERNDADRFEGRDRAFHETLRQGFLDLAKANPKRCVVIDGSGSEEDVATRVWAAAQRVLGLG